MSKPDNIDIRIYLTEDEVLRLVDLIEHAEKKHPCDRRILNLLVSQYNKVANLKGGTNNA